MLEGVLQKAGFRGTDAMVDPESLSDAARFLIDLFQTGNDSETELVAALKRRGSHAGSGANVATGQAKADASER